MLVGCVGLVLAGIAAALAIRSHGQTRGSELATRRPVTTTTRVTTTTAKVRAKLTDAELVRALRGAIFRVDTEGCGVVATGSAWAIDTHHLVTNAHVVAHDPNPTLRSPSGLAMNAAVVGVSSDPDVAVLEVKDDLRVVLPWADTSALEEGEHVVGLGFPVPGTDFSASPGTIVSFQMVSGVREAIRTDASLDHGDSGGPLVTEDGSVAGVVTELAQNDGGVQNVVLAYTADALESTVRGMIERTSAGQVDCRWVAGTDISPVLPDAPAEPGPVQGDGYDVEADDPGPVPTDPPTTTSTTIACPTGRPQVRVTEVRATEVDPEYLPGTWDVTVKGTIRNDASATINLAGVTVRIGGATSDTYGTVDGYALRPGASTSFEAHEYGFESTAEPDSATALLDSWSWDGYEYYDCGTD